MQVTNNEAYESLKVLKQSLQILEDAMESNNVDSVTDVNALAETVLAQVTGNFATQFRVTMAGALKATAVVVLPATITVEIGDTFYVTAAVTPAGSGVPVFTSSDETVATVNGDGLVTAVTNGSARIIATVDGTITDTCIVTVNAAAIAVTGVTVAPETAVLSLGGISTATIVPTIAPANATVTDLVYTSAAPAVATFADGVITGISEGNTVCTVSTVDGGFVAFVVVTVGA
jgi:uncharacterized protein YjdB